MTDAAGKPLALRSTPRREIICSKIEQQISAAMLQGRTYLAGLAQKMRKEGAKEQCGGPLPYRGASFESGWAGW